MPSLFPATASKPRLWRGNAEDPSRQDFLCFHNAGAAPRKPGKDVLTQLLCPVHKLKTLSQVWSQAQLQLPGQTPTTRKVLLTQGEFMALGTREPIIPFLISPFIFTCFSCSSRGPSVQLAPSPRGMRNKPWRQRFNPSQARKGGMRPQARKCPLARSCCTVVLLWGLLLAHGIAASAAEQLHFRRAFPARGNAGFSYRFTALLR